MITAFLSVQWTEDGVNGRRGPSVILRSPAGRDQDVVSVRRLPTPAKTVQVHPHACISLAPEGEG